MREGEVDAIIVGLDLYPFGAATTPDQAKMLIVELIDRSRPWPKLVRLNHFAAAILCAEQH
jgi:hypothetical protein